MCEVVQQRRYKDAEFIPEGYYIHENAILSASTMASGRSCMFAYRFLPLGHNLSQVASPSWPTWGFGRAVPGEKACTENPTMFGSAQDCVNSLEEPGSVLP